MLGEYDRNSHVAYIEEACLLTCPYMRVANSEIAVLHRHRVAAKWHKLGAMCCMEIM